MAVNRMTMPWTENGATWLCANDTDQSLIGRFVNNCTSANRWGIEWWSFLPRPYSDPPIATASVPFGQQGVISIDVKSEIQAIANGTNHQGWFLSAQTNLSSVWVRFASRETSTPPKLTLTVLPSCMPTGPDTDCDGIDDDCNGSIDDAYVSSNTTCGTGACARTGTTSCSAGSVHDSCTPGTPASSDATCNAIDDNCNGSKDEGYVAQTTMCGVGACARTGMTSCVGGAVQNNCTPGAPAATDTTCNGVDDNCNGTADEGYVSQASVCGSGACASTGTTSCVAGQVQSTCMPGTPAPSDATCNGIDEDCSGTADEDYGSASSMCTVGGCRASGTLTCVNGAVVDTCLTNPVCVAEINCGDHGDNDGDGQIDCADTDCAAVPPCSFGPEVCGNTIDDDGDGSYDCADSDCATSPACTEPPPRAEDVAPPLGPTTSTPTYDETKFIYAGPSPVQFFMQPATITPARAALLRGSASDRNGASLSNVRVTVLNHPEYGESRTSIDGVFTMVVNGGGTLVLRFALAGFLPVDRNATPAWDGDVTVDPVVLTPLDSAVTTVSLNGSTGMQLARANSVTDADGTRRPTILFPAGVGAQMIMPNGTVQPLPEASVRATELTVGDSGKEAMVAPLPPNTAYTHMVELSVDQAQAAGAASVKFSQPVIYYSENFIHAPTGSGVPTGYYDRAVGQWVASKNGRVIAVLSENAGRAVLDVTGSGSPATAAELSALGVSDMELTQLASLYDPGASLWRVPIPHFTPWDCNWPYGPPPDFDYPPTNGPNSNDNNSDNPNDPPCMGPNCRKTRDKEDKSKDKKDTDCPGSQIGCFNQSLGEDIPITGTPFKLHYESESTKPSLRVKVSNAGLPASVRSIDLNIQVAGRQFLQTFPISPNQTYTFNYDGDDAFGRGLTGTEIADVELCYRFPVVYYSTPAAFEQAFAVLSGGAAGTSSFAARGDSTMSACRTWKSEVYLGSGLKQFGLWDVNVHHELDPVGSEVHLGDGGHQPIKTLYGSAYSWFGSDNVTLPCPTIYDCGEDEVENPNGIAQAVHFGGPSTAFAQAADGTLFVTGSRDLFQPAFPYVVRYRPNGASMRIVGTPENYYSVTPRPAPTKPGTRTQFARYDARDRLFVDKIVDMAIGPDNKLYVLVYQSSFNYWYIYRFNQDGSQPERFAGDEALFSSKPTADGLPANTVRLTGIAYGFVFGPDGSLYIVQDHRVRRIGRDGIITTIAGKTVATSANPAAVPLDIYGRADSHPTRALDFDFGRKLQGIAVMPSGELVLAVYDAGVMVIGTDGNLRLLAGGSAWAPSTNDQIATVPSPIGFRASQVRVSQAGDVYVLNADVLVPNSTTAVWWVVNGALVQLAGQGTLEEATPSFIDGMSAGIALNVPNFMQLDLDGTPLIMDSSSSRHRIYRITKGGNIKAVARGLVPAANGREWWEFSGGLHRRTIAADTGATLLSFGYDAKGKLTSITDGDDNVTQFERNGSGEVVAIHPPQAPSTQIELDGQHRLRLVTAPDGGKYELGYDGGNLTSFKNPRSYSNAFTYLSAGRLQSDTDAANGVQTLTRSDSPAGFEVQRRTTGIASPHKYRESVDVTGVLTSETEAPDGAKSTTVTNARGWVTTTAPDGTTTEIRTTPDPRMGELSPIPSQVTTRLPSGKTRIDTETRTVTQSDPLDPFSMTGYTIQRTVGTRGPFVTSYDSASRTYTTRTPVGRETRNTVDAQGRVLRIERPGRHAVDVVYDAHGRRQSVSMGSGPDARVMMFEFDATSGYPVSTTGPVPGEGLQFVPDIAGRPLSVTRGDSAQANFTYDLLGNTTSVTPPGSGSYVLTLSPLDAIDTFADPPSVSGGQRTVTDFDYTPARALDRIVYPGARSVDTQYDPTNGRVAGVVTASMTSTNTYAPNGTLSEVKSVDADGEHTVSFAYDGSSVTSMTWAGTPSLTHGSVGAVLDVDLQVDKLQVNGSDVIDFSYDADGLLQSANTVQLTRAAGSPDLSGTTVGSLVTTRSTTQFGELASESATWSGTPYYSETIGERDKAGRILQSTQSVTATGVPQTVQHGYEYDLAGRLRAVTTDGVTSSRYVWDSNSNLLSRETPAATTVGRYDNAGRLTRWCPEDAGGSPTPLPGVPCYDYTYRDSGELLTRTPIGGGSPTTFDYDEIGKLRSVVTAGGRNIKYEIDAVGRRVGKTVDGIKQWGLLYLDSLRPIAQLDANNAVVSTFTYASRANVPDLMTRGGVVYRFITDHLGSVRLVVNTATGAVAQRIDYDELGNVLSDSNPGFQPFGFAGGLYDADTGLVRFGARDYDAMTGRWTAKDPLSFGGGDTNLYAYAGGDPINFVDPSGLSVASAARCFGKGLLYGAAAAVAIGVAAAAAATVLPTAVVTGALIAGAAAGAASLGWSAASSAYTGNWDQLAYDAGTLVGGAAVGGVGGRLTAEAVNGVKSPPWSISSDAAQHYDPSLGTVGEWLGTGLNPGSAGAAVASGGSGVASASGCDGCN
jgi:RHS repeat-associated protein